MSSNNFFGWDLLFRTIKNDIKTDADILVALVHWFMVRNSSFRCLSTGDDKTLNDNETGSELLPDLWNDDCGSYTLRYVCNKKLYILYASKLDDEQITFNILDANSRDVSNLTLNFKKIIKSREGTIEEMIPEVNSVINRIKNELIEPINTGHTKEGSTQTTTKEEERYHQTESPTHPLLFPNPPAPFSGQIGGGITDPLRDIGRGDLDPFGRGGGMLFPSPGSSTMNDPFAIAPGRNPGLRIPPPPGARFDPFGPPDANVRPNPNPDHFRPPPDFDDMYM